MIRRSFGSPSISFKNGACYEDVTGRNSLLGVYFLSGVSCQVCSNCSFIGCTGVRFFRVSNPDGPVLLIVQFFQPTFAALEKRAPEAVRHSPAITKSEE